MKTMTSVEMMWSTGLFLLSAAMMPRTMPSGTEKMTEMMFRYIDVGRRSAMMDIAERFISTLTEVPQFHSVKIFFSQLKYCCQSGVW